MDEFFRTNRSLWDGWTRLHRNSSFYDVEGFRAGRSSLRSVELEALGDVRGRSLLHLQCHFGLDTLSWARLGARVTGVDFSGEAIDTARALAAELGLPARFVNANIYDLPDVLDETFDIVFTSYGVLAWLPDLRRWAAVIARFLAPRGTFFIVEFHPLAAMFDDAGEKIALPGPGDGRPIRIDVRGSYAEPDAPFTHESWEWVHGLGDVVNAIVAAGLRIERLDEFGWSAHGCFPFTRLDAPGRWVRADGRTDVPLMFSLRASRPLPPG